MILEPSDIAAKVAEVSALIEARIGPKGPDLGRQLRRTGRRLPSAMRRQGAVLEQAQRMAGHPRLYRQIDGAAVALAHARLITHLETVDPLDRRRGTLLGLASVNAFNLLVVGALIVAILRWRGLV